MPRTLERRGPRVRVRQEDDRPTRADKVLVEQRHIACQLTSEAVPVPVADSRPGMAEVAVPTAPGLGVTLNTEIVEHYRVDLTERRLHGCRPPQVQ